MARSSKFANLVHYIISEQGDMRNLGIKKLNKVLWYADTIAYRATGKTITSERYIKRQCGPVPKNILATIRSLERKNKILTSELDIPWRAKGFVSLSNVDITLFSREELKIVDTVLSHICNKRIVTSISDMSYNTIWDVAELGEEIPMFVVLAGHPGVVTKRDQKWANGIISKRVT